ncbi:MAG: 30S ribosomal protein S12 methylthiotransferase RimO [Lentisphaerota bacterium]
MPENPKYIYFVSLGCSKNFVDTEVMAAALIKNSFGLTDDKNEASVCVINTCAFIPPARTEAENNIQELIKWKNKKKASRKLVITGCLTQWDKDKTYSNKYPEVDLWLGLGEIPNLPSRVAELFKKGETGNLGCKTICDYKPDFLYDEKTPRLVLTPGSYAFIKIADGCDNRCSYCSIPSIRGGLRSRSIESVVSETKNLVTSGIKEIIVIAQDITAFSRDKKEAGDSLAKLLGEMDKIEGVYWIRLHYLHPEGITDELIETIKKSKHIIPYLDIPLQHISDSILTAMNRKVSRNHIVEVMAKLRNINGMIIRTTFLVGFPGETENDFKELEKFVRDQKFERVGVFPFYPEPGTKASTMPGKVPDDIAKDRAEIIQKIQAENSLNFNSNLVGKTFNVILDSIVKGYALGRTYMDSPDIDNTVVVSIPKGSKVKAGEFVEVKIESCSAFELKGTLN